MKWPTVEIRDVAEVASGFGFPRKHQGRLDEEFPFYKVGDMNTEGNEVRMIVAANTISEETLHKLKAKAFPAGTVIFPKIGAAIATNKKRILTQPSVVDNNVMGFVPSEHIDEWYLYYWMQQFDLRTISNAGPVPSMRKSEVERVRIPYPPRSEQQRIVELLDQADALRRQRQIADHKTQRILPALFYKMFGDPTSNPRSWDSGALGEFGASVRYGLGQPPAAQDAGVPMIRATNIKRGIIDAHDVMHIDPDDVPPSKNAFLQASEVIVVRSGAYTGDVAHVGEEWAGSVAGYDLVITPDERFTGEFLSAMLLTPFIQDGYFRNNRHRAGQPHLNASQLLATPVIAPPIELQQQFSSIVRNVLELRTRTAMSATSLARLLEVLFHRAFSGTLTSGWREAHKEQLEAEMQEQLAALEKAKASKPKRGRRRKTVK